MNAIVNLYLVLLVPVAVVVVIALIRWFRTRDSRVLGSRLRRWGFWSVGTTTLVLMAVISLSMLAEPANPSVIAAIGTAVVAITLPLGTWFWMAHGGRGVPAAMWVLVGAILALALAACLAPAFWTTVVDDVYPVGVLTGVVALAIAVWGRAEPVAAGVALIVVGTLPLALIGAVAAAGDILLMLFAPLAVYALLGVLYLVGHRLESGPAVHDEWQARRLPPPVAQ